MPHKKLFILSIGIIQILLVGFLIQKIIKSKLVLGESVVINPQKQEDYSLSGATEELKYFFEPKASSTRTDQIPWLSKSFTYKLNSESLNEDREYEESKPTGVFRIVSLGDSYTFGLHVDPPQNYTKRLEVLLNQEVNCSQKKHYEVINLGVPGYDIQYSIERFKRRGQNLNPDLVIWILKYDDFFQINELTEERSQELKKQFEQSGEQAKLEKQGKFYEYKVRARQELIEKVTVPALLKLQANELSKLDHYWTGPLLIFALPPAREIFNTTLIEYAQTRSNIYYYDNFPNFQSPSQLLADGHPNVDGHEFIAQNLFEYIQQNQLSPCRL